MKSLFKKIVVNILENQVKRLIQKNNFKIVGVVGSIGKTSTKNAIATTLSSKYKVRFEKGNYNDITSVPLVFFGQRIPVLWNVFAWIFIFISNEIQIHAKYPYDIVVLELGTDGPDQIIKFKKYLKLDISFITAVTPEHMEYFKDLESVFREELSILSFSEKAYINKDLCESVNELSEFNNLFTYGTKENADVLISDIVEKDFGFDFSISGEKFSFSGVSRVQLYSLTASYIVAKEFGVDNTDIQKSFEKIVSVPGRMQILSGIKNSIIIDDSYNASPASVKLALDTLYSKKSDFKVAILGMMNELGESSKMEHENIGKYCDPKQLAHVVTIGKDANNFLAPVAQSLGCNVYVAKDAKDAGIFVANILQENSLVLVKGSQNGVFAEEAIKYLLQNKEDEQKLVRQSTSWLKRKSI